ncbi:DUF4291 domain-containing protein [Listeria costaricensis]|uniref:DUF4291 domain-containing protein n=1 Tax=Listeria costaricensis TaxID=2026604 RepID=UPI000C07C747|nr:DUF4291 domain-containing protein [Listeria costaricensis]
MTDYFEIRATYDAKTITVYQAYNDQIADVAVREQKFGGDFSFGRMTWIKPSFLWMMERSGWGSKKNQERILAVKLYRPFFDDLIEQAVLTSPEAHVYPNPQIWEARKLETDVYAQWDPERSIHGKKLEYRSLQIGISRNLVRAYSEEGIAEIVDMTPTVKKCRSLLQNGKTKQARAFLPNEKIYPVEKAARKSLGMNA